MYGMRSPLFGGRFFCLLTWFSDQSLCIEAEELKRGKKPHELIVGHLIALLVVLLPDQLSLLPELLPRLFPHFLKTIVVDSIAKNKHLIDVFRFPMHSRSFQASFHHELV